MGKLYLLPNLLGETPIERVIPGDVIHIIKNIKVFATENVKNTRRYLKKIDKAINIDELVFLDLNEHSDIKDIETYLPTWPIKIWALSPRPDAPVLQTREQNWWH